MLISDWHWYVPEDTRTHVALAITLAPGVEIPRGATGFREFARELMAETGWRIATSVGYQEIDGEVIITVVRSSVKEDQWRTHRAPASS